jgi:predicted nucleic acid-binding protein
VSTLFDTSVWIPYLRDRRHASVVDPIVARGRVLLHTVVLLELYAGTANGDDKRDVDALAAAAARLGRIVHPGVEDLTLAGQVMSDYARRHGRIRPRDHSHDVLIAIGAARARGLLLTENLSDMRRWAPILARRAKLKVEIAAP